MKLLLTRGGTAELYEDDSEEDILWASDADEKWTQSHPQDFLGEKDIDNIIDFLLDENYLDNDAADSLDIEEESIDNNTLYEDPGGES